MSTSSDSAAESSTPGTALAALPADDADSPSHSGAEPVSCRPFLKWAGGKTQLLPQLCAHAPKTFGTYFEPFLGSGALYFRLQPKKAFLSDNNADLINAFQVVRDALPELVTDLGKHVYDQEYFYVVRNIDRTDDFADWSPVQRASRLIFLNKTCYNGLYRVNSKGHFNTPFGSYTNPRILDAENLAACHRVLQDATIELSSFEKVCELARGNDFVYFDPPYVPLSDTAHFTAYSKEGFSIAHQERLRDVCVELSCRGVKVMLSNSSAPIVRDLYQKFHIHEVQALRAINSKGARRGKIRELIITNYPIE